MFKTTLIGNLTAEPVSRTNQNGKTVCNFSVAVNKKVNGQDVTTFVRCSAWNKTGELCQTYLHKGSKVYVEGEIQQPRVYTDKNGQAAASLDIMVNAVEFLTSKQQAQPSPAQPQAAAPDFTVVEEDTLPF